MKGKNNKLSAINVSYTDKLDEREFEGLYEFKDTFSSKVEELIILTKDLEDKKENIILVPLWKWLLLCEK